MTKRLGPDEWKKLVHQLEESELTHKEFAERQGVSLSSLQFWMYKLRREARRDSLPTLLPVEVVGSPAPSARRHTTVASPQRASGFLELLLPSGATLRFTSGTDVGYLKALLAALR